MKKSTVQSCFPILTLLLIISSTVIYAKIDSTQSVMNRLLFERAKNLRYNFPDSSIYLLDLCYNKFIEKEDTTNAIEVLFELAQTNGHHANYKESYDKLWKALLLADEAGREKQKAKIYNAIGRYYSFYKRKEKALEYFSKSYEINKKLVASGELKKGSFVQNFAAFASTFRELNEPQLARTYLDSCFLFFDPNLKVVRWAHLKFEEAFLLKEEKKYEEALDIFLDIIPWFEENSPSYLVLVYTYTGDTYMRLGNYTESESCYQKALEFSEKYNSHIDFSPLIHQKLSDLYYSKGEYEKAFLSLKAFNELDEKFFDSRSENNRPLLEIQDAFRKEKENQKKLLQEQRLIQLENEEKVLFLQKIILMGALVFLFVIGVIYLNYVRAKHRAEKQLIQKKKELEIQQANEMVELKNKELAASTLKLIEKDEFLSEIKNKLAVNKGEKGIQDIKRIVHSVSVSNAHNWKEFQARFVAVNKRFYQELKARYPNLTQGDLKLCALIKLNFSSKDMAKLVGISVESVHTTRYRLRKKLNLTRDVNLTEFIANL